MAPRVYSLLRTSPPYRADAFLQGLRACGFEVHGYPRQEPRPGDTLLTWNRYGHNHAIACRFERAGARVWVAENGYLGREWRGSYWYSIAQGHHNGAGRWWNGEDSRWDDWGVELQPWRTEGQEIVVLATRHIGPPHIAEPKGWAEGIARQLAHTTRRPVRVRAHPGENRPLVPLGEDLANAWAVVTWGSGAALKALAMGVPVLYGFPQWIGAPAAQRVELIHQGRFLGDRLPMFRRLAWGMWNLEEIQRGEPFQCLVML